jgi:four helix bundle protein
MPIRSHTDLVAWQLANQLRILIYKMTSSGPAARDFKFRDQLRDASSSVCRLLAEGFYRYLHPDFAHYVSMARGELGETQDGLQQGAQLNYWTTSDGHDAERLSRRTMSALAKLHSHLRTTPTPR